MIADDYRDIEAGYVTKRNGSLDRDGRKVEVIDNDGEPVDGDSKFLKRSFGAKTSLSLQRARQAVNSLLKEFRAEDLTYSSVRIVTLDPRLSLSLSFYALEENGIRSAPIFDLRSEQYIGVLTFSDLVETLLHVRSSPGPEGFKGLQGLTIEDWRGLTMQGTEDTWSVFINADASLYEACCVLQEKKLHRLPVFSRKSNLVIDVMNHARILHFIYKQIRCRPATAASYASLMDLFNSTLDELGIGTFCNITTLSLKSTVAEALMLFSETKLSCLPVTDETGRIVDTYNRIDVAQFCRFDFDINLDFTLQRAIKTYRTTHNVLELCSITASLREIFEQFNKARVHRLYCVDDEQHLMGVISLSDVFRCFL